jgi:hypothetical protein
MEDELSKRVITVPICCRIHNYLHDWLLLLKRGRLVERQRLRELIHSLFVVTKDRLEILEGELFGELSLVIAVETGLTGSARRCQ